MPPIPATDVTGQQTLTLPATTQPETSAKITINRNGTGGSFPWLNQLTQTDTLNVLFEYSLDGGQTFQPLGGGPTVGGTTTTKGVVTTTNEWQVSLGVPMPVGTTFRVTITPSTPITFSGTAAYQ